MKIGRIVSIFLLAVLCLGMVMFVLPSRSSVGDYDPWLDINDDGTINMRDLGAVARAFGTSGTPINKTALLLELQSGFVSISPVSFFRDTPSASSSWYSKDPTLIVILSGVTYYAVFQLPNNVVLKNITAKLWDVNDAEIVDVCLYRCSLEGDLQTMAQLSSGAFHGGDIVVYNDTISYALIDNQNCTYSISLKDTPTGYGWGGLRWIVLEYEYPS